MPLKDSARLLVILFATSSPVAGQSHAAGLLAPPDAMRPAQPAGMLQPEARLPRMVVAGILGTGAGWLGGGALGVGLASVNPFDGDELDDGLWTPGFLIGLQAGQAVAIPLAVHLANGRRGSLASSVVVASVIGAVTTLAMWTADFDALFESPGRIAGWVVVPVSQIATSILIERRTAR